MPPPSFTLQDVTTINYTLEWPNLENPSNTTFAGPKQFDICRCGPLNTDLGHVYTRYRCQRPKIRFATPNDELWVLQAPLGQVNLLRPANKEELQRRREIHEAADPNAYAGKNFLLLSGPCPRGRYQALATLQFLESLIPAARQHVESLSLVIQPYEEDCSDDQGGRAYIELASYIMGELPNFKTLCLHIWGEETSIGSREFAMVFKKEGVKIVVSWDRYTGNMEEYGDVEGFWKGVDEGVVKRREAWEDRANEQERGQGDGGEGGDEVEFATSQSRTIAHELLVRMGRQRDCVGWEEVPVHLDEADKDDSAASVGDEGEEHHDLEPTFLQTTDVPDESNDKSKEETIPTIEQESSDDDWSDALMTPLSPSTGEHGNWQML